MFIFRRLFFIFALVSLIFVSALDSVSASGYETKRPMKESKGWFGWGNWHHGFYNHATSRMSDFVPYETDGKHDHAIYNQSGDWKPEDWADQYDSVYKLIENFYGMDVIEKQYVDSGVPMLRVGTGFYHLSGKDKYRLMKYLDYVYGMEKSNRDAYFRIEDWYTKKVIGVYTSRYGLQLQ